MQTVVLDFETAYGKGYSLRSMPTHQYVRDARFKTHGVGIQIEGNEPEWITTNISNRLKAIDWANSCLIGHNLYFDGSILFEHFGIVPARRIDTLSLARGFFDSDQKFGLDAVAQMLGLGHKIGGTLNETKDKWDLEPELLARLGEYCLQDVKLTKEIYDILIQAYPANELDLIDLTIRMSTAPILEIDQTTAIRAQFEAEDDQAKAIKDSGVPKTILTSNPQFEAHLVSLGIAIPKKISITTGKETSAMGKNDPEFIELMGQYPELSHLWKGRLEAKSSIGVSRAKRWNFIATHGSRKMPMPMVYYGAHTGRWTGTDKINVQNLPRGSLLRKAIHAPKDHVILVADSSQIELRMNAWFCGQDDVLQTQREGKCVYSLMASKLFDRPAEDIYKEKGNDRQFGKIVILGCIAKGTPVLVKLDAAPFYTPIESITEAHKVWDGVDWVTHQGLLHKGVKECIQLDGIWMTPDHEILCENQWFESESVARNPNTLSQALETGSKNLPSLDTNWENVEECYTSSCNVLAAHQNTGFLTTTSGKANPPDVTRAQKKNLRTGENDISNTQISSLTTNTENVYSTEFPQSFKDAVTQTTQITSITAHAESLCLSRGLQTDPNSSNISYPSKDGMTQNWNSTEPTTKRDTNPEISDSYHARKTSETDEQLANCSSKSKNSKKKIETFDIALAGPRNRFTIKTESGHLIAHNCGYGMGWKKFKHFCASGPLGMAPIVLEDAEAFNTIQTYRGGNTAVVDMWKILNDQIIPAMKHSLEPFKFKCIEIRNQEIILPNGMSLQYPDLDCTEEGWHFGNNHPLWGGTLLENIIQALARIVVADQMLEIDKLDGVQVVGMTHDEVISVCHKDVAEERFNDCIRLMSVPPIWAPDVPLAAEGGWAVNYSK